MIIGSALFLRIVTGLLLSLMFGYSAYFLAFLFVDFAAFELSYVISGLGYRFLWFSSAGLACGLGVYIAWLGNGGPRWASPAMLLLALGFGFGGAWLGYFYSLWTGDLDPLKWTFLWERSTVNSLISASFCATGAAAIAGSFVQLQLNRSPSDPNHPFFRYIRSRRW